MDACIPPAKTHVLRAIPWSPVAFGADGDDYVEFSRAEMMMSGTKGAGLLDEATQVLLRIRSAFAHVLSALPGDVRRPRDLTRVLGVQQKLAWKIMRILDSKDPLASAQYIPGDEGVNIFLEAARDKAAPEDVLDRVRAAVGEYRRIIADHAGSRAALELMLGASARDSDQQTHLTYRKAGFQCASFTWGVQARVRLVSMMLYRHEDPRLMQAASVVGLIGLRRVRPEIRWTLWQSRAGIYDEAGTFHSNPYRPLDPDAALPSGVPLLGDFSTVSSEQIERTALPNGEAEDQWVGSSVGDKAAVTCIMGGMPGDAFPRYADAQNPAHEFGLSVQTPVELLINDLYVDRELFSRIAPEVVVYSELGGKSWLSIVPTSRPACSMLPCPETVEHLGLGRAVVHTVDIPRYEEIMCYAFDKLGWDIDACDVYRLRMPYPVVSTAVAQRFVPPPCPADLSPETDGSR
ncbi:MAG: hypothetical protein PVJ57_21590 [Phycisphaerae bacterium]|jgi:hypothetical protein